jgi:hypothetical protein
MFFAPIERLVRFIAMRLKAEGSLPATATQVLHTALSSWDLIHRAYVFEVFIANKDTEHQQIYIRADPNSSVKHTITSEGLPLKGMGVRGSRLDGREWKQSKKWTATSTPPAWQAPQPPAAAAPWSNWNQWKKTAGEEGKDKWQDPAQDPWKNW